MSGGHGAWLTSFQAGKDAEKPTLYEGASDISFYFGSDTGVLYVARAPAGYLGAAVWVPAFNVGTDVIYSPSLHTLVIANMPTEDPEIVGALWSNDGVVTLSAGA